MKYAATWMVLGLSAFALALGACAAPTSNDDAATAALSAEQLPATPACRVSRFMQPMHGRVYFKHLGNNTPRGNAIVSLKSGRTYDERELVDQAAVLGMSTDQARSTIRDWWQDCFSQYPARPVATEISKESIKNAQLAGRNVSAARVAACEAELVVRFQLPLEPTWTGVELDQWVNFEGGKRACD